MFNKKQEKIYWILLILLFTFGITYADDVLDVKTYINNMRYSTEDSWILWDVFIKVFDVNWQIKEWFLYFASGSTDWYIPIWEDSKLVESPIYATWWQVWIWTTSPSVDFEVAWDARVDSLSTACVWNCWVAYPAIVSTDSTISWDLAVSWNSLMNWDLDITWDLSASSYSNMSSSFARITATSTVWSTAWSRWDTTTSCPTWYTIINRWVEYSIQYWWWWMTHRYWMCQKSWNGVLSHLYTKTWYIWHTFRCFWLCVKD